MFTESMYHDFFAFGDGLGGFTPYLVFDLGLFVELFRSCPIKCKLSIVTLATCTLPRSMSLSTLNPSTVEDFFTLDLMSSA